MGTTKELTTKDKKDSRLICASFVLFAVKFMTRRSEAKLPLHLGTIQAADC